MNIMSLNFTNSPNSTGQTDSNNLLNCALCHASENGAIHLITMSDGKNVCHMCYQGILWAESVGIKNGVLTPKTHVSTPITEPIHCVNKSKITCQNQVRCPKCKIHFTTQKCGCGFKNPMFR